MDPPSTPRRLGVRNLNQKQKEPAYSSPPKHVVDTVPQNIASPHSNKKSSGEFTDESSSVHSVSSSRKTTAQLAEMFDSTLRLAPTSSPAKPQPTPVKKMVSKPNEENQPTEISMLRMDEKTGLKRRNNKENTRPNLLKEDTTAILPPISESGTAAHTMRKKYDPLRNLTVEEREKLAKPQVKRLANVAQLCMSTHISK